MERECIILPVVFVLQSFVSHLRKRHLNLFKSFIKFCYVLADGRGMTLKNYNGLKREVLTPVDEFVLLSITYKIKRFLKQYLPEVL